jgi:hypothetical protein
MDSNTSVAIMFISAFSAMAFIIDRLLSYRLKSKVVRSGLMDIETIKLLNQINGNSKFQALKWALLLLFAGLGLVIIQFIPYNLNSPLPYGIEAVSIAIGFFIYYLLIFKRNNNI